MARDLQQNFCVLLFQNTINKQSVDIVIQWADLIKYGISIIGWQMIFRAVHLAVVELSIVTLT